MEYTPIRSVTAVAHPAADRASAYGLERILIDGNDADAVYAAAAAAIATARDGGGPSLVAAPTYRYGGHSRADPGKYRPAGELEEWMKRDAIALYRARLLDQGTKEASLREIESAVQAAVEEATEAARQSPPSGLEVMERAAWPTGGHRGGTDLPRGGRRRHCAGDGARRSRRLPRRGRGRGGRRVQDDGGPVGTVRPQTRARHADLRAGHHRRGDGRGDDGAAAHRRDHVLRLPRRLLGHGGERDRQGALHVGRADDPASGHPHGERLGRPVRRPALAKRGELGHVGARAQSGGPLHAGRREGAARRGSARPRPGDLLRAQGTVRHQGAGAGRRARRSAGHREGVAPGWRHHRPRAGGDGASRAGGGRAAAAGGRNLRDRGGRPLAGPARYEDHLGRDREDRAPVHGGGEPAAVRLGRGDRLHRRRGVLLRPGWTDRAHRHAARSAARGRRSRGRHRSLGGADRGDDPEDRRLMDVVMPQLGETVKEGTVTVWHKKVGERVDANEPLFGVNTDKVETEVPAPVSGVVSAILVAEGSTVPVGARLAVIEESGKARPAPSATPAPAAAPAPAEEREPRLSPVVRRLLAEYGLEASAIRGSGAGGRVTRDDVLAHLEKSKPAAAAQPGGANRVALSKIRRRTAEQMALSWRTI